MKVVPFYEVIVNTVEVSSTVDEGSGVDLFFM